MTNTRLLKARMVLNNDTVKDLADAIGINRQNASLKINGKRDFKQRELDAIRKRYRLENDDFLEIFFHSEGGAAG